MKGYYNVFNFKRYAKHDGQHSGDTPGGDSTGLPAVIDPTTLARCSTREARGLINYEQASSLGVLPLGVMKLITGEVITFASRAPHNSELIAQLKFITGRNVKLISIDPPSLDRAIFSAYHGDDSVLRNKVETISVRASAPSVEQAGNVICFRPKTGDAAILLAALTDYAISHCASDLHILPRIDGTFVRLRINGELRKHDQPVCPLSVHTQLINRIKVLCGLDLTVRNLPHDGSFSIPAGGKSIHIRVSIMPTVHGEKAVMRLLGCDSLKSLPELGFEEDALEALNEFMRKGQGAVIFAGPTGSGKSTSMYAMVESLAKQNLSCASLEDPVELHVPGVAQTSVNSSAGLDYAAGLRSLLRQDPDVILLGEIRDDQSAQMALQAAVTGHVLLSSIHARNSSEVLLRLRNFGVDDLTLAQSLQLVICQRLVPTLCSGCRVVDLNHSNKAGFNVYRETGCAACDYSGYYGRALVCDCLRVTDDMSQLIAMGRWQELFNSGTLRAGLVTSMQSGLEKLIRAGKIAAARPV